MATFRKHKFLLSALIFCALLPMLLSSCVTDTVVRSFETEGGQTPGASGNAEERIVLNVSGRTMEVGETFNLVAAVVPAQKYQPKYTYLSSDAAVAAVGENGVVTAVGPGTCVISVTTGILSSSCLVTVAGEGQTPSQSYASETPGTPTLPPSTETPDTPTLPPDTTTTPPDSTTVTPDTPTVTPVTPTLPTDTTATPTEELPIESNIPTAIPATRADSRIAGSS